MRISDWSSDVCSSDLLSALARQTAAIEAFTAALRDMDKLDALTALETAINAIDAESEADIKLELTAAADTIGAAHVVIERAREERSEEHTSELQSLMRITYAVYCLKKKKRKNKSAESIHRHT